MSSVNAVDSAETNGQIKCANNQNQDLKKDDDDTKDKYVWTIRIDLILPFLTLISVANRLNSLDKPNNVVFDELHYMKYISYYMRGVFFFDNEPPLGKIVLAIFAQLVGFDGNFEPNSVGDEYTDNVKIAALRALPALCGGLIIPLVYLILKQVGLSQTLALLGGVLVLFDNALLTQSRFVFIDSMYMLVNLLAFFFAMKFVKVQKENHVFTFRWFLWLSSTSMMCAFSVCIRHNGWYTVAFTGVIILRSFWTNRVCNVSNSPLILGVELFVKFSIFIVCISTVIVQVFTLHFKLLPKAGVHDSIMSPEFQASLEGGIKSVMSAQPNKIAHGSQITIRHTHGKPCWLHSHKALYPIKYPDGRGSSHQQQVTCYQHKDVNNFWIVKRPGNENIRVETPVDYIKHGDVIQLVHGMTLRALNSHDVGAPVTSHNQEISCYIDYNISMPAQNLWRVEMVNRIDDSKTKVLNKEGGSDEKNNVDFWTVVGTHFRLIHNDTNHALRFQSRILPEWGYHQNEVTGDRLINQADTVFSVEEHFYSDVPESKQDQENIGKELIGHKFIPMVATELPFVVKFNELIRNMFWINRESAKNHNYASTALEWLTLERGVAYYVDKSSNNQIYLIGNVSLWFTSLTSAVIYITLLIFYGIRRQRKIFDIPQDMYMEFIGVGGILLTGYAINFVPFIFSSKTLFLYHYLPAYIMKIMLTVFTLHHLNKVVRYFQIHPSLLRLLKICVGVWLLSVFFYFGMLSPLSIGDVTLSKSELSVREFKRSWEVIKLYNDDGTFNAGGVNQNLNGFERKQQLFNFKKDEDEKSESESSHPDKIIIDSAVNNTSLSTSAAESSLKIEATRTTTAKSEDLLDEMVTSSTKDVVQEFDGSTSVMATSTQNAHLTATPSRVSSVKQVDENKKTEPTQSEMLKLNSHSTSTENVKSAQTQSQSIRKAVDEL